MPALLKFVLNRAVLNLLRNTIEPVIDIR